MVSRNVEYVPFGVHGRKRRRPASRLFLAVEAPTVERGPPHIPLQVKYGAMTFMIESQLYLFKRGAGCMSQEK